MPLPEGVVEHVVAAGPGWEVPRQGRGSALCKGGKREGQRGARRPQACTVRSPEGLQPAGLPVEELLSERPGAAVEKEHVTT